MKLDESQQKLIDYFLTSRLSEWKLISYNTISTKNMKIIQFGNALDFYSKNFFIERRILFFNTTDRDTKIHCKFEEIKNYCSNNITNKKNKMVSKNLNKFLKRIL